MQSNLTGKLSAKIKSWLNKEKGAKKKKSRKKPSLREDWLSKGKKKVKV